MVVYGGLLPPNSSRFSEARRSRFFVRFLGCFFFTKVRGRRPIFSGSAFCRFPAVCHGLNFREGRIADPRRQEPDVIGNATTPQIGGFYANFGKGPQSQGSLLGTSSLVCEVLAESDQAFGREGRIADPHRQEPEDSGLWVIFDIRAHASQMYQHPRGHRLQGPLLGMSSVLYWRSGWIVSVTWSVDASRRPLARGERSAAGPPPATSPTLHYLPSQLCVSLFRYCLHSS